MPWRQLWVPCSWGQVPVGVGEKGMGMLGVSGGFTQSFCVGKSRPEWPREGLGEQHCTPMEPVTPDLLHHGTPRSHQPLQVPGCSNLPWVVRAANSAISRGVLALGVPRVPLGVQHKGCCCSDPLRASSLPPTGDPGPRMLPIPPSLPRALRAAGSW